MRHDAFIRVQYSIDIPRCISHFVYHILRAEKQFSREKE